jgi:hypothetical protein
VSVVLVLGDDAGPSDTAHRLVDVLERIPRLHPEVELHVMLLRGGPQIHRFHELAPTTVVEWYDRRADLRGAAAAVRGRRRRGWLANLIDRYASETLHRKLPRVDADVVLVSGREASEAGPLGVGRRVPRVLLALEDEVDAGSDALAERVWTSLQEAMAR